MECILCLRKYFYFFCKSIVSNMKRPLLYYYNHLTYLYTITNYHASVHQCRKYLFFSSRSIFFWIFPGGFMCSPNRCQFSRKVCLFAEQIQIFQEDTEQIPFFQEPSFVFIEQIPIFQEHFFSYRTDTNFPGALFMCYRTDINFPGAPF